MSKLKRLKVVDNFYQNNLFLHAVIARYVLSNDGFSGAFITLKRQETKSVKCLFLFFIFKRKNIDVFNTKTI